MCDSSVSVVVGHSYRTCLFFFFNDTATTEIYTLSLHDALPISERDIGIAELDQLIDPEEGLGRGAQVEREELRERHRHAVERSEEHTSELQSQSNLVCRLLLEKKNQTDL